MGSWLKLVRYPNLFMVFLTMFLTKFALIDSIVLPKNITQNHFYLLILSVVCITASGYVINDIFDVLTDSINKPNKVYIGNTISIKSAWLSYTILNIIGLLLGGFVSYTNHLYQLFWIFPLSIFFLFFYALKLKRSPLLGNILIGFLTSLTIILPYVFSFTYTSKNIGAGMLLYFMVTSYAIFAFFTTLIREIIKDIEDIKGDYQQSMRTFPICVGRHRANRTALGFTLLLIVLLAIFIRLFTFETPYLLGYSIVCLLLPLLFFSYKLYEAKNKKDYRFLSIFIKLIMFFGILSMIFLKLN